MGPPGTAYRKSEAPSAPPAPIPFIPLVGEGAGANEGVVLYPLNLRHGPGLACSTLLSEIPAPGAGLKPPLFATATLGNAEAPLRVVLEEMAGAATDAGVDAPRAKPETKVITMGPKGKKGNAK